MTSNWVIKDPDGKSQGYFSGFEIMDLCRMVHWENLPDPSVYVGTTPLTTSNKDVYVVFGVDVEGKMVDTGFRLDGRPEGWSRVWVK